MHMTSEGVGRRLRGTMAEHLMTQKSLAQAVGMTQQALSSRIRGQVPFTVDQLTQIADYLGTTPEALLRPAETRVLT